MLWKCSVSVFIEVLLRELWERAALWRFGETCTRRHRNRSIYLYWGSIRFT